MVALSRDGTKGNIRRRRRVNRKNNFLSWLRLPPFLGVSPEWVALALVLWCMMAFALHVLLATDGNSSGAAVSLEDQEMDALRAISRRASHNHHGGGGVLQLGRGNQKPRPRHPPLRRESLEKQEQRHQQQHKKKKVRNQSVLEDYEAKFPPTDTARIQDFVHSLRDADLDTYIGSASSSLPYDILNCPDEPPPNYPVHYSLLKVLQEWPVDELQWPQYSDNTNAVDEHPYLFYSLCIFDWEQPEHRARMHSYAVDHDVPFVVRNQPTWMQTTERWMRDDPAYLTAMIGGDTVERVEHSTNNHLPYWKVRRGDKVPEGWVAPSDNLEMSFDEWNLKAVAVERAIAAGQDHIQLDHYYFRLSGSSGHNDYLYDELPLFDPQFIPEPGKNIFMLEPAEARGINCRWGMAGNVAETHYDASRNWIVLLGGGQRRYILSHPQQCPNLALYPIGHPSARHSSVDWSEIGGKTSGGGEAAQKLAQAQVTQVVLQASDSLFLPQNWFHFIVSLNRNYQCNARSGVTTTYNKFISDCGFPTA